MNDGYVKIYRKMIDTSFYKKPNMTHFALHCLFRANHKPTKIIFNKQEMTLQQGEFISGRKTLAKETGLSEQEVRTCVDTLSNIGFLTIKSTNRFTIFHVEKYDFYQYGNGKSTSKSTNKQPTSNQQATTDNNDKNVKNEKKKTIIAKQLNPLLNKVIKHICNSWEVKKGSKYHFTGKHASLIAGICRTYGNPEAMALWDLFLLSDDPFFKTCGYSIECFATSMPKLVDQPFKSVARKYEKEIDPELKSPEDILKTVGL